MLIWAGCALLLWLAGTEGLSLLLNKSERLHNGLAWRLSTLMGRPVQVGNFEVALLGGPRITANDVTVEEDPRFGHEYFLRAERLTASVRWRVLLAGRLEFGTLSFTRPSLNLVRMPDGAWNIEDWLSRSFGTLQPRPAQATQTAVAAPSIAPRARIYKVEIDTGRVNFKRGVDKHPFALIEVNGSLEQMSTGQWRMDLEAVPMRAGVSVQQPGLIRARGTLGGAAARLRPADLTLQWGEVSLSDALRLARGHDYGVRGNAAAEIRAVSPALAEGPAPASGDSGAGAVWSLTGAVRLTRIHRWDLPQRASDPAVNLHVDVDWWPQESRVEVKKGVLEAAASNVRFSGFVRWAGEEAAGRAGRASRGFGTAEPVAGSDSSFRVASSSIGLSDCLAWYRAFRPGVAPDAALDGNAGIDLEIRGWPPRVERATWATGGALLRLAVLPEPISLGRMVVRYARDAQKPSGRIELEPTVITLGPRDARNPALTTTLRLDGAIFPGEAWKLNGNLNAQVARAQDLEAAGVALGVQPLAAWTAGGWVLEGPVSLRLRWQGPLVSFAALPSGTVDLRGSVLHAPFLNEPVRLGDARIELGAPSFRDELRVTLNGTQALGTRWSGTLRSRGAQQPWEFALAADRIEAPQLDRWLNPGRGGERRSLLQRLMSGGTAPAQAAALPEEFRARGQISIEQFVLAPLTLRRLRGQLALAGGANWKVELSDAQADFYGGAVRGSFVASGTRGTEGAAATGVEPGYDVAAQFERVNLAALTEAAPRLRNRFAGLADARLELATRGVGRDALLDALEGKGSAEIRGAKYSALDPWASLRGATRPSGAGEFRIASAEFHFAKRALQLESVRLTPAADRGSDQRGDLEGGGTVNYVPGSEITLDVSLAELVPGLPKQKTAQVRRELRLSGTLAAPQVTAVAPSAHR